MSRNRARRVLRTAVALVGCVFFAFPAAAENWPRFRGADGSGVSAETGFPETFSPGDLAWNIELPGEGHSAPVIWDDSLFVTSAEGEGETRHLLCLNSKTGEQRWTRQFHLNRGHKHQKNSWASSTPATDGERVYVAFADDERVTLAAYDFAGELVWRRNLGPFESQHGLGASPIVHEGLVFMPNDQDGPSFVSAFDAATGRTVWSELRAMDVTSYATPIIVPGENGAPQLICSSKAMGITSLDPHTGSLLWKTDPLGARSVSSPVYLDGLIMQCSGGGGVGQDLITVSAVARDTQPAGHVLLSRKKQLPYVPNPILLDGHAYFFNDKGIAICVDLASGKDVWTNRLGGNFTGSPIYVDGKIYILDEAGDLIVVKAAPDKYQEFARIPLGDPCHSTPSAANGRLYFRTFHRLMCLEGKLAAGQ